MQLQMRVSVQRLLLRGAARVEDRPDPLPVGGEAVEGHHVDGFVEMQRDPKTVMGRQRTDTQDPLREGLAEIGSADRLAHMDGRKRRRVGRPRADGIPVLEAVLMCNGF